VARGLALTSAVTEQPALASHAAPPARAACPVVSAIDHISLDARRRAEHRARVRQFASVLAVLFPLLRSMPRASASLAAIVSAFVISGAPVAAQGYAAAILHPTDIMWKRSGPNLEMARVEGDFMVADKPYAVLLRLKDGAWISPHWHPREQRIVVMSGTLRFGLGESLDSAGADDVAAGGFVVLPAAAHHYEGARGETTFLIMGIGPMQTFFVGRGQDTTHRVSPAPPASRPPRVLSRRASESWPDRPVALPQAATPRAASRRPSR
jgi:quercetin dioxygenase-like cupin family protein